MPGTSTHTTGTESRLALSELAPETLQSEIRAMTTECDRIGGINLAQGVCDTPVPEVVEAAAIQAIRAATALRDCARPLQPSSCAITA